ncbi:MAG: flavodoxin-dependent (E)-4-hydroxy-3-methylbut-2-enyl-diphosphate synthase [Eubacteriales bacterium]|nr:flavodoxin-dependent (E)-4-hydroxy-3-methylbut-2-enyl-diphosphate synthase [Eubacteriales bacterium]
MKNKVIVGNVEIGGLAPVSVQSMTNTKTEDAKATIEQIKELHLAGCDIVRVSVYSEAACSAIKTIVENSPVPLVADIHFNADFAIKAMEAGISKVRINPGNIEKESDIQRLADCAKSHRVPIRIGVNTGSVPKDILSRFGGSSPKALVESAKRHIQLLEKYGFYDIVISIKSSDVKEMVLANRLADKVFPYPLHIGVTESGLPGQGTIKSAIGIGALLLDGIGNTLRVSLSGSPIPEAAAAISILKALHLRQGVDLIVCPTCGRTDVDVASIAKEIEEKTRHIKYSAKVAVMGCIVNGPGEAKGADIALCGGKNSAALYVNGVFVKKLTESYAQEVLDALNAWHKEQGA